jgi:hypothetical protein
MTTAERDASTRARTSQHRAQPHVTLRLNDGLRNNMPIRLPGNKSLLLLDAVIYAAEQSAWSCRSRSANWFRLAKVRVASLE